MSTPISIPCDLACEVQDGVRRADGRLRVLSDSSAFVQMESGQYETGQPVRLLVPAGGGLPDLSVDGVIARPLQRRAFPGQEPRTGVELAFLSIHAAFDRFLNALSEDWIRRAVQAAGSAPPLQHARRLPAKPRAINDTPTRPTMTRPTEARARDRRAWERHATEVALRLWTPGAAAEGAALNVSEGGALIVTPAQAEPGALFRIEVDVPERSFTCEAQVVRLEGTGGQRPDRILGVRFVSMRELLARIPGMDTPRADTNAGLRLDLRDRETLVSTYLRQIKQGTLTAPARGSHAPGSRIRVELLLPPPRNALEIEARVERVDASGALVLELLESERIAEAVHQALGTLWAA